MDIFYIPLVFASLLLVFVYGYIYYLRSSMNKIEFNLRNGIDGIFPIEFSGKALTYDDVENGYQGIFNFARENNIKYVVGINMGGIIVGAHISLRLEIDDINFLRGSVPFKSEPKFLDTNIESIQFNRENILVVDDVSRTGNTLEKAINLIRTQFESDKLGKVLIATLLSSTNANFVGANNSKINYSAFRTKRADVLMPWHSKESAAFIDNAVEKRRIDEYTKKLGVMETKQFAGKSIEEICKLTVGINK